VTLVA